MKKCLFLMLSLLTVLSASAYKKQMTPKQAWEWQERVGVIKGFNQPEPAYPGQTNLQILQKAQALGFNSVRFWIGGKTLEDHIDYIKKMIVDAEACGMTIQPVIWYVSSNFGRYYNKGEKQPIDDYEQYIKALVKPFAKSKAIAMWDIWNEPTFEKTEQTPQQMALIEQIAEWMRQADVQQPITSSIFWDTPPEQTWVLESRIKAENKMDLHNFHSYACELGHSKNIEEMMQFLINLSDRPLIATECLTRVNGSGVARSLDVFAKHKVNFYIWGLYSNDANWEVKWRKSAFDAYGPMFHNLLYSDGDMIDSREVELIQRYSFDYVDKPFAPDVAKEERWTGARVWQWMASGPIVGADAMADKADFADKRVNAEGLKLSFSEWKEDHEAFYNSTEDRIKEAIKRGHSVLPLLLTDADAAATTDELCKYVADVLGHYYMDNRIMAWELYRHPGEQLKDAARIKELVDAVFTAARWEYANQPVFITPLVSVAPFAKDFDYRDAMVHGHRNGWNKLQYEGASSGELTHHIWALSDIISFSSSMPAAETGWLTAIAYRYGRPIFCMQWAAPSADDVATGLKNFANSHVYWFAKKMPDSEAFQTFKFNQVSTGH